MPVTVWTGAVEQDYWLDDRCDQTIQCHPVVADSEPGLIYGSGPPLDSIGLDGEYYECCVTGQKWGPKLEGKWPR